MNNKPTEYKLSIKEEGFITDYLSSEDRDLLGNGTKCILKWYDIPKNEDGTDNENLAGVMAYNLLRKDKIKKHIEEYKTNSVDLLEQYRNKLIKHAFEMGLGIAKDGNAAVLNNLINKLLPTLNANENNNTNIDPDEYLTNLVNNLVKQDKVAHIPADESESLVKSSNNNNLENN